MARSASSQHRRRLLRADARTHADDREDRRAEAHGGGEPARPAGKIADHAAIGNLRTMALVSTAGAIDFMCWPDFDSPSVFASLLDPQAGEFSITPEIADARVVQSYIPDSNVLVTRWLGESSSAEIFDLMTVDDSADNDRGFLLRQVRATRGTVRVGIRCKPRFDYARAKTTARHGTDEILFHGRTAERLSLRGLTARGPLAFKLSGGAAEAHLTLEAGAALNLTLGDVGFERLDRDQLQSVLDRTNAYWQHWAGRSSYKGRWRDRVTRSALALKMMTSRRYGSIVAAATFGLPESKGGVRNWDYRATWIRDASFTVYSLNRLGYREEGMAFARWVSDRARQQHSGALKVMYAVDGKKVPGERNLAGFAGYADSRPVRIGNQAAKQLQLDIYGALLDAIYLNNKYGEAISHADWEGVCRVVRYVSKNWRKPDAGIWELRGQKKEHLHSRLMCWVAVDRAIRLSVKRSLASPLSDWLKVRSAISADIWDGFWNEKAGHFGRSKGSTALDGAMLMMPLVRFVGATDPQWLATLDAIGERLGDDVLIMRYREDDGLGGHEGAFGACAFWYVECLARAGRIAQARAHFEKLLAYGNHVGLYSEEFSPKAEFLGNFPQALTHLAMISAAFFLDRAIEKPHGQQWPA
jgi:GH15 family glucan-1,4-alpha-glucosidase